MGRSEKKSKRDINEMRERERERERERGEGDREGKKGEKVKCRNTEKTGGERSRFQGVCNVVRRAIPVCSV